MKGTLLGVNELKAYLNSREFDDEAIVCLFDTEDRLRYDIEELSASVDYLEDDLVLDINVRLPS